MEDALKRLDVLTQEEARMAVAENLRATHAVDERVRGVTERVLVVDDRVAGVNDRVDQVIRSSFLDLISAAYSALPIISFQKTNYGRTSTNGSPHWIHPLTIISPVILITRKAQHGSSRETFTGSGNQRVPSFGFTESVRSVPIFHPMPPDDS